MREEALRSTTTDPHSATPDLRPAAWHAPATPAFPAWLTSSLPGLVDHATVVAHRAYRIDALAVDQPVLILPLAGTKRVEPAAVGGR